MTSKHILSLLAMLAVLSPASSFAASKKKEADRELARRLSASLLLVASEGEAFAQARSTLAKARLRNIQKLEEGLVELQEENDMDARVWKVLGETYRVKLLQGVFEVTDQIAAQEAARTARQKQHELDLAATKSAVNLKKAQLLAAAKSLAALAEPPGKNAGVSAMVQATMTQFASSLSEGSDEMKKGLALVQKLGVKEAPAVKKPPG